MRQRTAQGSRLACVNDTFYHIYLFLHQTLLSYHSLGFGEEISILVYQIRTLSGP